MGLSMCMYSLVDGLVPGSSGVGVGFWMVDIIVLPMELLFLCVGGLRAGARGGGGRCLDG